MKDKEGVLWVLILSGIMFCLGLFVGLYEPIKSKDKLPQEIKIEIFNGVSDTTYIYRRP